MSVKVRAKNYKNNYFVTIHQIERPSVDLSSAFYLVEHVEDEARYGLTGRYFFISKQYI